MYVATQQTFACPSYTNSCEILVVSGHETYDFEKVNVTHLSRPLNGFYFVNNGILSLKLHKDYSPTLEQG